MINLEQIDQNIRDGLIFVLKAIGDVQLTIQDFFGAKLLYIEIFSGIFTLFFLWVIIYCIVGSQYAIMRVEDYMDYLGVGNLTRRRSLRGWKQILKRLESKDSAHWKVAILEADRILDEIIKSSGYKGETVHERFNQVTRDVLPTIEEIRQAHKIRDRIISEPDFLLSQRDATAIIAVYKKAFLELNLLDE